MQSRILVRYARETPDFFIVTADVGTVLENERVTFIRDRRDPTKYYELQRKKSVGAQWRPIKASRYQLATEAFKLAEAVE